MSSAYQQGSGQVRSSVSDGLDSFIQQEFQGTKIDLQERALKTLQSLGIVMVRPTTEGCMAAAAAASISKIRPHVYLLDAERHSHIKLDNIEATTILLVNPRVPDAGEIRNSFVYLFKDIIRQGHSLAGICDARPSMVWDEIVSLSELSFRDLVIKPPLHEDHAPKHAVSILADALGDKMPEHARQICQAALDSNNGIYSELADTFRRVVRSDPTDRGRLRFLVDHYATNLKPDSNIQKFLGDYQVREANSMKLLSKIDDLHDGVARFDFIQNDLKVDFSLVSEKLAEQGFKVIILSTRDRVKRPVLNVRTVDCEINLSECLSPYASSPGQTDRSKAYVKPEKEGQVIRVLKRELAKLSS